MQDGDYLVEPQNSGDWCFGESNVFACVRTLPGGPRQNEHRVVGASYSSLNRFGVVACPQSL